MAAHSATAADSFTLATLRLVESAAGAGVGFLGTKALPVHVEVTAIADENGTSLDANTTALGCTSCLLDAAGDVNQDGAVNVLDATLGGDTDRYNSSNGSKILSMSKTDSRQ